MFTLQKLQAAAETVYQHMPATPQYAWPLLAQELGGETWVKHENHTPTGAFKVRGGFVLLDALKRQGCEGIISATRGNHGQSLALAGQTHAVPVTIVVPKGNSTEKNDAIRAFGAELIEAGNDFDEARAEAKKLAASRKLHMVPPFAPELVQGVASYSLELFDAVPKLDVAYVSIGMGSGICGMIAARDALGLDVEIVGVVSDHAPAYALSFAAGEVITTDTANTFADGLACRQPQAEALAMIRAGAARIVRVTDEEIERAIQLYYRATHQVVEGAGAAPLAGLMQEQAQQAGKTAAVILSGGNIDASLYQSILNKAVA